MEPLHCIETEKEIIGNLLNHPDSFVDVFGDLTAEDFSNVQLAKAFVCLSQAYGAGEVLDMVELAKRSKIRGELLMECVEAGWLAANIKYKANRVIELAHKRRTYRDCVELMNKLHDLKGTEISAKLSDMAGKISLRSASKLVYNAEALVKKVVKLQEERVEDPGYIRGVISGYGRLDDKVRGFRPKRMTVIAAATGFGKTSLALNLFSRIVQGGNKALYITHENDVDDNLDRMAGIVTGLDLKHIEAGNSFDKVHNQFVSAFWGKTMFMTDNAPRTIDEDVALMTRYKLQENIDICFLDYIGEISGEALKNENEEAKLTRYANRLLDACKGLGVHLVVLAQLNREGNKRGRPTKAELAGCFKIAQKAHSLLIFWQEENKQDVVTIDKNRQGPAGVDIAVEFNRKNQRITEQGIWLSGSKEIV